VPESIAKALAGAPWGLVSYRLSGGSSQAGVLGVDGKVRALEGGEGGMRALLANWEEARGGLVGLDPESLPEVAGARLGVAIADPPKIVCAAANYHRHVAEMGGESPPAGVAPYFFLKPPGNTLVADGAEISIGSWGEAQVDWEAELAVVIGARASRVAPSEALDFVAGYTVLNDLTDRSRLVRAPSAGAPFTFDWLSSKARDGSCPLGSAIVPGFLVDEPESLPIRLWVNEVLKQDSTTADMIDDVPTLIAAASEVMTLEPGDILATGTPAGVGKPRDEYLQPGDTVTIQIDGVGRLSNTIVG
jgi:2-keto-4-pentenoate hydratase/2-oxohepta-3-ene-1,7-dioic acid hydratase in catechol pathway